MEIRDIDYGVAFSINDHNQQYIEMNKDLKEDPILYTAILGHELEHTNKIMYFWLDFKPKWYSWRLLKWSLKHPRSFYALSWIYPDRRINYYMLLVWISAAIIMPMILWFILY